VRRQEGLTARHPNTEFVFAGMSKTVDFFCFVIVFAQLLGFCAGGSSSLGPLTSPRVVVCFLVLAAAAGVAGFFVGLSIYLTLSTNSSHATAIAFTSGTLVTLNLGCLWSIWTFGVSSAVDCFWLAVTTVGGVAALFVLLGYLSLLFKSRKDILGMACFGVYVVGIFAIGACVRSTPALWFAAVSLAVILPVTLVMGLIQLC
jgi:hypothetical protein